MTIFSTTKAFRGHIGVIQTNAIQSWTLLRPKCEIILFGKEEGTAEIASRFGITHIPDVDCNEYGTPLVSSMFNIAQNVAKYQIMCYVNADIILMSDFLPSICKIKRIKKLPFLLVGQRWDLDLENLLDFNDPDWEIQLRKNVKENGSLHESCGIDYFVFSRGLYHEIPSFAIGRPGWDNWMIYRARSVKALVIDGTKVITVVHQNHDYSHLRVGEAGKWKGPEAKQNIEILMSGDYAFEIGHATWVLTPEGLKRALAGKYIYCNLRALPILFPRLYFLNNPKKMLGKLVNWVKACFLL